MDQTSGLGYVNMQKNATEEVALEAKQLFRQYSMERGMTIKACQADNGIFRANEWQQVFYTKRQALTCIGINAHATPLT